MRLKIILSILLILNLAGCATAQKKSTLKQEIQQHQMRITELEDKLQQGDERIARLEKGLANVEKSKSQNSAQVKKPSQAPTSGTPTNIQTALKNAGLYEGPIDGKIGKKTKKAIIDFQKLNGLTPDGVVGKKTWVRLEEFLY